MSPCRLHLDGETRGGVAVECKWYGLIVWLVEYGLQIWVSEDLDSAVSGGKE